MPEVTELTLSISLVVFDLNESELEACLTSVSTAATYVEQTIPDLRWHLTLVDNDPSDRRLDRFLSMHISVIENSQNEGFGRAHNQVIQTAQTSWHLILNPDVVMDQKCLWNLLQLCQSDPEIVMAGPYGETVTGDNAYLCKKFPSPWILLIRGFFPSPLKKLFHNQLTAYECRSLPADTPTIGVEIISGCCMLARTDALKQAGGFDPRFFLYFEDFDLSVRLRSYGKIAFQPHARIIHNGGQAAKKGARHIAYFCRSALHFFIKHRRYKKNSVNHNFH